jgi:hypothetical protein
MVQRNEPVDLLFHSTADQTDMKTRWFMRSLFATAALLGLSAWVQVVLPREARVTAATPQYSVSSTDAGAGHRSGYAVGSGRSDARR